MCDDSPHLVVSWSAMAGEKLIVTDFAKSITRGFAAVGQPEVAVLLLPGTELMFDDHVRYDRAFSFLGKASAHHKVARFQLIDTNDPHVHHDIATGAPVVSASPLSVEQLDQLVAPIALYADPLVAQILMAATYPLEIVEADRWLRIPANASWGHLLYFKTSKSVELKTLTLP
jgi:hypothetical protein